MPHSEMKEPRRFVRVPAQLPIAYRALPSPAMVQSTTCDLAGSGFCLLVQEPLARGTQVQIELRLPERERPVLATGEVMWCERHRITGKSESRELAKAGVRFLHVDPRDHDAILQYVAAHLKLG